jgi:alkylation response protein AidB-like acyl-CoA dehydrogenase
MSQFHIHIDAQNLAPGFERFVIADLGFWRSDFSGHPEGVEHYEPPHHFTQKTKDSKEFKALFDQIVGHAKAPQAMKGYIEGEFVPLDRDIALHPYDASVPLPFKLERTFLPAGTFRETEVHVTLDRDRSEPQLLRNLLEMGLFAAYLPKTYGTAAIFTAQGSRAHIDALLPTLAAYLERAGGAVECSIKEERIAHWWMSEPALPLPPVVESIQWTG